MEQRPSTDNQARPITRDTPLDTTVASSDAHVSGLVVRFGTFKRRNIATVEVSITRTTTNEARSAQIDTTDLVDNASVTFRFAAFSNAAGEAFKVSLRSSAGPDRCVAVFLEPGGALEARLVHGEFALDGTRILLPSDLMVQTVDTRAAGRDHIAYGLTHWWVDRFGVYVEGSLTALRAAAVRAVRLSSGEATGPLAVEAVDQPRTYRFFGYLACRPGETLSLLIDTDVGPVTTRLELPYEPIPQPPSPELFLTFIDMVNRQRDSVLEVGSRKSSPFSVSNRPHFGPHIRFIGFDILPGENTDVVGDAHYLTRHFPERSLGAAYSLTVLEHLIMPWRFAVELNRVLEMGALVFHATHQTWPVHAEPNDFYRFSDEALKFMFGTDAGFEIIDSHMEHRFWLYPTDRTSQAYLLTPLFPGYGNSQVLARKVRHLDADRPVWDVAAERLTERSRQYPRGRGE